MPDPHSESAGPGGAAGPAPAPAEPPSRAGTAVTWLGHATALIEIDGVRLLTDPVLRPRIGPLVRIGPAASLAADTPVHGVLLSHLHADHADLPSLRSIGASVPVFAPRPAGEWLRRHGVANVSELRPGDEARVAGVRILATAAEHDRRRHRFGPAADPIGFVVRGSGSAYFAGDTDLFGAMCELAGSIDIALLPIAGWGPTTGAGHLDPARAAIATSVIAPRVVVPIHWGTLALPRWARRGRDPAQPARDFAALVARDAPDVEVRVLAPGQRTSL